MSAKYGININQTTEEAFKTILNADYILLKHWGILALNEKDNEVVHQMRVCLRKMRSLLSIFQPILPEKLFKNFFNEMHYFSSQLDKARDFDVYLENNFFLEKNTKAQKLIYKLIKAQQKKEYKKIKIIIKSTRLQNFYNSLDKLLATNRWQKYFSSKQKNEFNKNIVPLAAKIIELYKNNLIYMGINIDKLDDKSLHKLRIQCKKLRYSTEFFKTLFNNEIISLTNCLKEIQDILGILHDETIMKKIHKTLLKKHKNRKIEKFTQKLEKKTKNKNKKLKKQLEFYWGNFLQIKKF